MSVDAELGGPAQEGEVRQPVPFSHSQKGKVAEGWAGSPPWTSCHPQTPVAGDCRERLVIGHFAQCLGVAAGCWPAWD
jgi:hypothetical protein